MIGLGKSFAGDSRGAVTVELALLAPILAMMIIGVADISIAYGQKLELEQGAQRAIEKVMQTTGNTTVADTLQQEVVCQVNGTLEGGACATGRVTAEDVTVGYRLECVDEGGTRTATESDTAAEFDALTCPEDSSEARYLNVTVVDTYTPMFPIHWGTGGDGDYDLSATAGVRTQ
jgi:Flp pilus assembly protein TadG